MIGFIGNSIIGGMAQFLQLHAKDLPPNGFGLNVLEIGLIWGISGLFGAVSNIFWGALSDRTHTRWGKRKPYMFIFAPLAALLIWLSASVDVVFGWNLIFWNFLVFLTIKNIIHSGASVPYTTVIPEVVPPEKRVVVSQLSAVVNGAGTALGGVVPTLIWTFTDNFQVPFIVAGIFLVISYYISAAVIPKEKYKTNLVNILDSLRSTFKDRNYMNFQIGQALWTLALNVVLFMLPFLATDMILPKDLTGSEQGAMYGLLFISFLGLAGVFLVIINYAVEKRHVEKKKALMFSLIFTTLIMPLFALIGSPILAFIPVLAQAYIFGSLIFIGLIGVLIFPYAVMMALFKYDEGMAATYNGVNGFIVGLATIPAGPVGGAILMLGYPIAGIFCSVFFLGGIIFMARVHVPEHLFQKKATEENVNTMEAKPLVRKDDLDSPAVV